MGIAGTATYMAPELIAAHRHYTPAVDIYALGVSFWEIWSGIRAYADKTVFEVYDIVSKGERPDINILSNNGSTREFISIVTSAWHADPEQRPTAEELIYKFDALIKQERSMMMNNENYTGKSRGQNYDYVSFAIPYTVLCHCIFGILYVQNIFHT